MQVTPKSDEIVDAETGEVLPAISGAMVKYDKQEIGAKPYHKVAEIDLTPEQMLKLMAPLDRNDVEIRPDGLLYLPEIKYRRTLNRAIGPGKWAIVRRLISVIENEKNSDLSIIAFDGDLYINGSFEASAIGEQRYYHGNPNMTYASAAEGAKSDCLVRCCKDLGIASELWDPQYIETWKKEFAIEVWCVGVGRGNQGKKEPKWRKKTAPALTYPWKESGSKSDVGHPEENTGSTQEKEIPFPGKHAGKGWDELDAGMLKWAAEKCEGEKQEKAKAEMKRRLFSSAFGEKQPIAPSAQAVNGNSDLFPANQLAGNLTDDEKSEIHETGIDFKKMMADGDAKWPTVSKKALVDMWENAVDLQGKRAAHKTAKNAYDLRKKSK